MIELNKIYNEDCLEGMKRIPDKSVDMILCDLPYGTTACKWDVIIPFEPLWEQYERIIKDNGATPSSAKPTRKRRQKLKRLTGCYGEKTMETNYQHWENEIKEIDDAEKGIAIVDGKPASCMRADCHKCLRFQDAHRCRIDGLMKWSAEPYIQKPLLTGDEAEFIMRIAKLGIMRNVLIKRKGGIDRLVFYESFKEIATLYIDSCAFTAMELDKEYTVEELIGPQQ